MSTLPSPSPSQQLNNPNPTTPAFEDDAEWIMAYLKIHALSHATWRYAHFLWIGIILVSLTFAVFHLLNLRSGVLGAYWSKWYLRRRTWRKKHSLAQAKKSGRPHKQPLLLPSNSQLLTLSALTIASLAATFLGPDYIAPASRLFHRAAVPDVAAFIPQYTIQKAWWASGNRAGLIAFSLFPLCVLFALKRAPFAIFAIPFFTNLHSDKLIWLHRWIGRLIWALVALHATLWSVQLFKDRNSGTGDVAYVYAWHYQRFIFAWTAFILFTLLILLSLGPIRDKYYDTFYTLHIILVPATIIMSALHHPPLWWWCWLALFLWAGERIWRAIGWLYLNGFLGRRVSIPQISLTNQRLSNHGQGWELPYALSARPPLVHPFAPPPVPSTFSIPAGYAHAEILAGRTIRLRVVTPGRLTWAPGQHFFLCIPFLSIIDTHPFTCASVCDNQKLGNDGRMIVFLIRAKNGWTKDLWTTVVGLLAHGQRHPAGEVPVGTILPRTGVLLKAWIDGPFGSPVRTDWGVYSTAVIVAGGSGASFAISVLEYLCLCMAGRDGKSLGGTVGRRNSFSMQRIRFVWILRDFAHLQWCASILHRCHLLVSQESLQLDLFVTNFNPPVSHAIRPSDAGSLPSGTPDTSYSLATPASIEVKGVALDQDDLIQAQMPDDDYVDLSYYMGDFTMNGELGHEEHRLDLTNFDGDNDDRVRGESTLNRALKKEGCCQSFAPVCTVYCPSEPHEPSSIELDKPGYGDVYTGGSSQRMKRMSTISLASQASSIQALMREVVEEPQLELGEQEMQDISVMAEFARPGRPKVDLILRDEVSMAGGRVVVACCGPTTLNAVVRKAVAAQIDPLRIRQGDNSGSIDLVVEEFGF
ncbi:hypothetical protein BJV77DRAFT_1085642 [Russula vinacea]|nr:hypothetical protein BJV77DRAFT_1085642 [Russula vinacea]